MFVLLTLALVVACLIAVPLLLVGLVLRLAIGLLLLPFRIAGVAIRAVAGLAFGLVFGVVGLILAGAVLLIPLLAVFGVIGGIWLILRMSRRRSPERLVTG